MSLTYALSAYPIGKLSDRLDHHVLLAGGLLLLIGADLLLGISASAGVVLLGVAFWGLHMGCTQGVLATMVADTAPEALRGTAFGIFNLASGLCMLVGSTLAGWLWDRHGAPITFFVGVALAMISLVLCGSIRGFNPVTR